MRCNNGSRMKKEHLNIMKLWLQYSLCKNQYNSMRLHCIVKIAQFRRQNVMILTNVTNRKKCQKKCWLLKKSVLSYTSCPRGKHITQTNLKKLFWKNGKKYLTIRNCCDIIEKLPERASAYHEVQVKIFLKKVKKGIDKGRRMWYDIQAVPRSGVVTDLENWTTKDEKTKPLNRDI